MKAKDISQATVRRCLILRHEDPACSFSTDTVYILSKIVSEIAKEMLYRSAINAEENCSERITLENLHRIMPQVIYDFNL